MNFPISPVERLVSKAGGKIFFFAKVGLFLLVVAGTDACRSRRPTGAVVVSVGEVFHSSCYPIESITVPRCRLEISSGGRSYTLNGNVYICADSVCYFRGMLLVEVVRGVICRDSFAVVNYMDRVCYRGRNEYLQKMTGYPVNPQSLLMLFTADLCEDAYREKFGFRVTTGSSDRIVMRGKNRTLLEMSLNPDNKTVERITLYDNRQQQATFSAAYGGYNRYEHFTLPTVFDISAYDGQNQVGIKADFQQILFNQPQQINFSIPSKYRIVTLQ